MSGNQTTVAVEDLQETFTIQGRFASEDPGLPRLFSIKSRGGIDCQTNRIVEGPISFTSPWENQVLPLFGQIYIGYIAREILDLAGLTRLVRSHARRYADQELIGRQIAEELIARVQPRGVAVYMEVHHLGDETRDVWESVPVDGTTVWFGEYETNPYLREEFFTGLVRKR